jgi:hypothetical protein
LVVVVGRRHGDSRGACRYDFVADRKPHIDASPRAPGLVGRHVLDRTRKHHRIAGKDRVIHAKFHPTETPFRPRPVGHVAFEPRGLIRRVHEDVARSVPVDRKVVIVMHRPPIARGQRAEHDRRRRHVVGKLRQFIAGVDVGGFQRLVSSRHHSPLL